MHVTILVTTRPPEPRSWIGEKELQWTGLACPVSPQVIPPPWHCPVIRLNTHVQYMHHYSALSMMRRIHFMYSYVTVKHDADGDTVVDDDNHANDVDNTVI